MGTLSEGPSRTLDRRRMRCFSLPALARACQDCIKRHLICMVWLTLQKKYAQLCSCVVSPGSHCFDFQPVAEPALVNDLQAETMLLVL